MEEVKAASLELLEEPDLEDKAPFFIEEEAEPSDPVDVKLICKHKGLIPNSNVKAC